MNGPSDVPGMSVAERGLRLALAPVYQAPPKVPRCPECGRSDYDVVANAKVISDTIFDLAEHAHGRPRQAVELSNPDGSLSPEAGLQSALKLLELKGLRVVKK